MERTNETATEQEETAMPLRAVIKFKKKRRLLRCVAAGLKVSGMEREHRIEDNEGLLVRYNDIYAVHASSKKLRCYFGGRQRTWHALLVYACCLPLDYRNTTNDDPVKKRKLRTFIFEMTSGEEVQELLQNLRQRIETSHEHAMPPSQRRLLVFINPFAGRRQAQAIFDGVVKPMLDLAGIDQVTCRMTDYDGHATEWILSCKTLLDYTDIVSISGDGVIHEIVNGLMQRPDAAEAVRIPLSVIPAGSGNALTVSLGIADVYSATWNLIKRWIRPMDLLAITQGTTCYYSFLFLSWAFLADVDIESDRYRWFGPARFTAAAMERLLCLRRYRARLYYLKDDEGQKASGDDAGRLPSKKPLLYTGYGSLKAPRQQMPDLSDDKLGKEGSAPVDKDWICAEDTVFTFFVALNFPYVSSDGRLAPLANFQDGAMDLCYTGDHSLHKLIPLFIKADHGGQLSSPLYHYHHVKAFYLEPLGTCRDAYLGIIDVDGERRPTEPCLVECLPRVVTLICPYNMGS